MKADFNKTGGLVPVIVQNCLSNKVLMLGYMNNEALEKTINRGLVTFFSRSKNRLWTKGETSGNFLKVKEIQTDCDNDTLLILAEPVGPTCHTGAESCFGDQSAKGFLYKLEEKIRSRIDENSENSYTNSLFKKGINKIAQKVGEEAVELVIEAKDNNIELFKNEAADLLYHFLILLKAKNIKLSDIEEELRARDGN
jgi:phosphoribosyl-AMP cyclohydrolase / phosphoribosyl-ATP pyrophosphohydrolase